MSGFTTLIDTTYERAKQGDWTYVLTQWGAIPALARRCSRFQKISSGWSFLHQAAYMGHEEACWLLVRGGACVALKNHQGETASDIAQRKGHAALAVWLTRAQLDPNGLWAAPSDPDELPSSNRWDEAQQRHAREDRLVAYAGSIVHIPSGARYFVDDFERTLIGWHGTFDPPMDMGGYALFETPT